MIAVFLYFLANILITALCALGVLLDGDANDKEAIGIGLWIFMLLFAFPVLIAIVCEMAME